MHIMRAALLLFLLSFFTAAKAAPIEITVWHAYRDVERTALEKALELIDAEDDSIVITALAIPHAAFVNKLEAAAPRGNGPDVFIAAHEHIGKWTKSKLIAELESTGDGLSKAAIEAMTFNGKLYGVPLASKRLVLFYNPELIPIPPQNTDKLISISRILKKSGIMPLAYEATSAFHHAPWLHGFGGSVFNEDGVGTLNSPENIASLEFLSALQKEAFIPEEPTSTR